MVGIRHIGQGVDDFLADYVKVGNQHRDYRSEIATNYRSPTDYLMA
ncbi:MAG: hypothetical protein P8M16_06470 [Acidimicrobiales bacterium]|nr:hypothetical protein [Acidimicrobiales bacterium]